MGGFVTAPPAFHGGWEVRVSFNADKTVHVLSSQL